jgi:hypothetical protein
MVCPARGIVTGVIVLCRAVACSTSRRKRSGAAKAVVIGLGLAIVPLTNGYAFWLVNHLVPRLSDLPVPVARMITALCLALPWLVLAGAVWAAFG